MGTWGTGIFDDDTACDTRDAFEDEVANGVDVATATKRVLTRFMGDLDDTDEGPVIYLALAALQIEHDVLTKDISSRALEIIEKEEGLDRWEEATPHDLLERKQVLEDLRMQLIMRQPSRLEDIGLEGGEQLPSKPKRLSTNPGELPTSGGQPGYGNAEGGLPDTGYHDRVSGYVQGRLPGFEEPAAPKGMPARFGSSTTKD